MMLIDEGRSSAEITAELEEVPFKSLLTKRLPPKLGGQWDVTLDGTPVGDYWKKLYLVRNSVVHAGLQPHTGHAEEAQKGYWELRDHLEARLWAKHKLYPRTLLVRLGEDQLRARGWLTSSMQRFVEESKSEPRPYWWPHDLATPESSE